MRRLHSVLPRVCMTVVRANLALSADQPDVGASTAADVGLLHPERRIS